MKAPRPLLVSLAAALGLAAGWVLSQRYIARYRQALFSPAPRRRHAALGYLAGRHEPEIVRLLRDYLAWERHPGLRRRAGRVVRALEKSLG